MVERRASRASLCRVVNAGVRVVGVVRAIIHHLNMMFDFVYKTHLGIFP
jgi:hypothetical protein